MGLHKCCNANLVRPYPRLAEIDGCILGWFSICGSHSMTTSPCLALNNRMLLYFIRVSPLNGIITTREWEETQSASVLFSPTRAVFHVSVWLWHNWAVIQHECTLKNKVTFRINWTAKMSACFSQFHDFPNYNLPSAWNSWSILFKVLFTVTQIPRVLYPSLLQASVQHVQHHLQFICLVT